MPSDEVESTLSETDPLQILVTNDDGYAAEGIDVLVEALKDLDGSAEDAGDEPG